MNYIIVEDEELAKNRLIRLMERLYPTAICKMWIQSVEEGVDYFKSSLERPEFMFMDIQLGDGLSFEILQTIEFEIPVIFTTAYDQYAIQAFDHYSISYILKPIQADDLTAALEKYKKVHGSPFNWKDLNENILERLHGPKVWKTRFLVQLGDKWSPIESHQVAAFYADGKNCFLVNKVGKRFFISSTLEKLMDQLDPSHFCRLNRKVILHIDNVNQILPYSKSKYLIKTHVDLPFEIILGSDKMKMVKGWLGG